MAISPINKNRIAGILYLTIAPKTGVVNPIKMSKLNEKIKQK